MTTVAVSREIAAPADVVFRAVAEVENLPKSNPDVVDVEFLSESRTGLGTRFVESRRMGKKLHKTELEITEHVENQKVRMVADSHGTVWDTLFTVSPAGEKTRLEIKMDARPHKLLPKLLNPLFKGMFRKGMAKYIDQIAAYCEAAA